MEERRDSDRTGYCHLHRLVLSNVQFSYRLQCLLNYRFRELVLDPVPRARDHDWSNVRVRMEIFDCAKLVDCRICEHDRHLPLVRYGVDAIEKVPWSILLSEVGQFN